MRNLKLCSILCLILVVSNGTAQDGWTCFDNASGYNGKATDIFEYDNDVWLATTQGILRHQAGKWTSYEKNEELHNRYMNEVFIDSKNNLWIGTASEVGAALTKGGLAKFDGNEWELFSNKEDIFTGNKITDIFEDSKGHIWVISVNEGTNSGLNIIDAISSRGGLSEYDGSTWINHTKSLPKGNNTFIKGISEDINGKIWFFTSTKTFFYYDGKEFTSLQKGTSPKVAPRGYINILYQVDANDNIWVAGPLGTAKYDGSTWILNDDYSDLKPSMPVNLQLLPNGQIVLITLTGFLVFNDINEWEFHRFVGKRLHYLTLRTFIGFTMFTDPSDNFWVYLRDNLAKWDGEEWHVEIKELSDEVGRRDRGNSFIVDSKENVWFMAENGLELKRPKESQWIAFNDIGQLTNIEEDANQNIWISNEKRQVAKYNGEEWTFYSDIFKETSGITGMHSATDGLFWVLSNEKVCYFKK